MHNKITIMQIPDCYASKTTKQKWEDNGGGAWFKHKFVAF